MYLAVKRFSGKPFYVIRESYRHRGHYRSRDLLELGFDPSRFIVYPGGNSFYIDETVEEHLSRIGIESAGDELEAIFWPFLEPEIRRSLECFRHRELSVKARRRRTPAQIKHYRFHEFDRRRLHFLKFGQMSQRRLDRLPVRLLETLFRKSRDEIEQALFQMERRLRPHEVKAYVYVIFDLQRFFSERFARENPEFLDQGPVDEHFLADLCRLNADEDFWIGVQQPGSFLHPYLQRYLFMFFDFDYPSRSFEREFIRQFIDGHRRHRRQTSTFSIDIAEARKVFGKTDAELEKMRRSDLVRLFRRKAQRLHPDKGGDQKAFVKLTEAYHRLLATKR